MENLLVKNDEKRFIALNSKKFKAIKLTMAVFL